MIKPCLTVQQHIMEEQRRTLSASVGGLSWLLLRITSATKMIEASVAPRRPDSAAYSAARLGETMSRARWCRSSSAANQRSLHCLGPRGNVAIMASKEDEEPIVVERH